MNKRLWIILTILVVIIVGGMVWWKNSQKTNQDYVEFLDSKSLITEQNIIDAQNKAANGGQLSDDFRPSGAIIPDHFIGKEDSKVIVIEYQDFACSHCQAFHAEASKIHTDYEDKVLFIHRNFTLGYPNSTATIGAAEASFLVGGRSAFWEMANLLFQDTTWVGQAVPNDQRKGTFESHANTIGLDIDKFNNALLTTSTNGIQDKINRDKELGKRDGVTGTPTWLLNGNKIEQGDFNDSGIRKLLDKALKDAK